MNTRILANVSCVAIDGRAIVIEGPPASGKTSLALALIDRGATLVGDDGITLSSESNALRAAPPPNTAGLVEVRNVGLIEQPTCEASVALILSLDPNAPRYPEKVVGRSLEGHSVPVLPFAPGDAVQALRAELALEKHGLDWSNAAQAATRREQ